MQIQIDARKQALKDTEVHTPTFLAPVLTEKDSVPKIVQIASQLSPTCLDTEHADLARRWNISLEKRAADPQEQEQKDAEAIFLPKAPSLEEHTRLAKAVVKLRMKRNRELYAANSKRNRKTSVSIRLATASCPATSVETRLKQHLQMYHRMVTSNPMHRDDCLNPDALDVSTGESETDEES